MEYLLVFLIFVSSTYAQVAIPPRDLGFVYNGGNPGAKVRVDFYISPLCPDSLEAWAPTLAMADHYGADNIQLVIYSYPLPYHQNSFYITRAAYVIHAMTNGTKSIAWLEHFLKKEIKNMNDKAYVNKSDVDLLDAFETIATDMNINVTEFITKTDRLNKNDNVKRYETYARYSWKTAAARGVAATPTWFVNGVYQPQIGQRWTLTEWKTFMDPLVEHNDDFDFGGTAANNVVSSLDNNGSRNNSPDMLFTLVITSCIVYMVKQFSLNNMF